MSDKPSMSICRLFMLLILGMVIVLLVVRPVADRSTLTPYTRADIDTPRQNLTPSEIYARLLGQLDVLFPGRGKIDYAPHPVADIAKGYAMVLSAELVRQQAMAMQRPTARAKSAARWLLSHADEDGDGVIGWGVPVAWDAFGDDSVNPADTEYTITTAIVVDALMDAVEQGSTVASQDQLMDLVRRALEPYLDGEAISPSGIPAYSLQPSDRAYDCLNPAAYLAGQMQRYADLQPKSPIAEASRRIADRTMQVLLDSHRISPAGHWYWHYSLQEAVPNDLPHACYIIDGIQHYIRYGGRLAEQFDETAVVQHMLDFRAPADGRWHAWPLFRDLPQRELPRLYGLGMALYLAAMNPAMHEQTYSMVKLLREYRRIDGLFHYRPDAPRIINEYQTYALYGLSHYIAEVSDVPFESQKDADQTNIRINPMSALKRTDLTQPIRVPLTFLRTEDRRFELELDVETLQAALIDEQSEQRFNLPARLIPLSIVDDGRGGLMVFARHLWSSQIRCLHLQDASEAWRPIALPQAVSHALFRKAVRYRDQILLITYDPELNRNQLRRLRRNARNGWLIDPDFEHTLLFKAYLGYEHQPRILTEPTPDGDLLIAAGPAVYRYRTDDETSTQASIQVQYFDEQYRLLDLCVTDTQAVGLYQHLYMGNSRYSRAEKMDPPVAYRRVDLKTMQPITMRDGEGIPHRLRRDGEQVRVVRIRSRDDLREAFLHDMAHASGDGVLMLGINNREGQLIWAQSYFLTGLIDAINYHARFGDSVFADLLKAMKVRLDVEMALVDQLLLDGPGLQCRIFSVNREPTIFAVQSGKLLHTYKRYLMSPQPITLRSVVPLQTRVENLEGHMEELACAEPDDPWLKPGRYYLRWPRRVPFAYDGTGIPYNHQNCWVAGLLYREQWHPLNRTLRHATFDIANQVLDHEGFRSDPPRSDPSLAEDPQAYHWQYWWGQAKQGWAPDERISKNTPRWRGDGDNVALQRYRTFDAIAILCAGRRWPGVVDEPLLDYFERAVRDDGLEPFLIPYLWMYGRDVQLTPPSARYHMHIVSPPDFRNAFWAYHALDHHMTRSD